MIRSFHDIGRRRRAGCRISSNIYSYFTTEIQDIIGKKNLLSPSAGNDQLSKYRVDWTRSFQGGHLVATPSTTESLSSLLKFCHGNNIQVVPQGGNTSLAGGSIPIGKEMIVSMEKFNRILEIDINESVLVAESGCILDDLFQAVAPHNLMLPIDLGARGSCMIGGNVATNAGGIRVLRYSNCLYAE